MTYYDALKATWATLPAGDTTAQKLAAVNALTVAGPNIDVQVSAVVAYLALNLKLAALLKYAANAPATEAGACAAELAALLNMGSNAPNFATSQPAVYNALQTMLTAMASDTNSGITSSDVTALMALAATEVPWWQATVAQGGGGLNGLVSQADLDVAGGLS